MGKPSWASHILRIAKEKKNWNQGQLADQAHVRPNTLSAALNGKQSPNLSTLEAVAVALDEPLYMLFLDTRQADLLSRHAQSEARLTNEEDIAARIEQRVIAKLSAVIREETQQELKPSNTKPHAVEPSAKLKAARSSQKKRA